MLEAFQVVKAPVSNCDMEAVLTFEERQKSRHKAQTVCGQALGWFVERGTVLADGDYLQCSNGALVRVVAAAESVSEVASDNPWLLMRAAYHLGNRHVPLQIGEGWLRYQHDHVLDDMVRGLGLDVSFAQKPFHPENGAYHGTGHSHQHGHHHHGHSH